MFNRNESRVLRRLGVVCLLTFGTLTMQELPADDPFATVADDRQATQPESLDVRYARAHLRLAHFDLQRALRQYRRNPELLPASSIDRLQRHITVDQEELKQALETPDGNLHQVYLRSAQASADLAKLDLARKQKALARFPSEKARADVERAELVANIANLHLEITQSKQGEASLSSMMYLQWQIEVLRSQIRDLRLHVETRLPPR